MKNRIVIIPNPKTLIKDSPGFAKKLLSDAKIDLMGLCGFGCTYCSSNSGNYLRINGGQFAQLTQDQLGEEAKPTTDPDLTFEYTHLMRQLEEELAKKPTAYGEGRVLMFSMLTDPFSPRLVQNGITRRALELLLRRTSFRIRILTKNSIVGSDEWVSYLADHKNRVIVGLSTGTLDAEWAGRVEKGTSNPRARLRALRSLQDAGIPTYGMLCPVFPDVLINGQLDELIDEIRPERCEHVWAEPFNDRANWRMVRDTYPEASEVRRWMDTAFGNRRSGLWGEHATQLYSALRVRAKAEGWATKLRYMLYEAGLLAKQSRAFCDMTGLLLQSPGDENGLSQDPHFRALQKEVEPPEPGDWVSSDHDFIDDETPEVVEGKR
jgi:DNA repair photolyase